MKNQTKAVRNVLWRKLLGDSSKKSNGKMFTKAFAPEVFEVCHFDENSQSFYLKADEANTVDTDCSSEYIVDRWYSSELNESLNALSIDPGKLLIR